MVQVETFVSERFGQYQDSGGNDYWRRLRKDRTIRFTGTGTAADDAEFAKVAATADTLNLVIEIEGTVQLTSVHTSEGCKGIRGVSDDATIEFGPSAEFRIGTFVSPSLASSIAINPLNVGHQSLLESVSGTGFASIVPGSFAVAVADNEIQEPYTKHVGLTQRPSEIFQILKKVKTGAGTFSDSQIEINGYLHDQYLTSPRIVLLDNINEDVVFEDFVITSLNKTNDGNTANNNAISLYIRNCARVRFVNVINRQPAAGQVFLQYVYDFQVAGSRFEAKLNPDEAAFDSTYGYGLSVGVVKKGVVEDNFFGFQRHGFLTTAGVSPAGTRTGQTRDVSVRNNHVIATNGRNSSGDAVNIHPTLDTHSEAVDVVFENNLIEIGELPSGSSAQGISVRSRGSIIRNNTILGDPNTSNVLVEDRGWNTVIEGNLLDGTNWIGVRLNGPTGTEVGGNVGGARVVGNTFRNIQGGGVHIDDGRLGGNERIYNNRFDDTSNRIEACVFIRAGSGHKINGNVMPKNTTTHAVALDTGVDYTAIDEYSGNVVPGYDICGVGFDLTTTDGQTLDAKFRDQNSVVRATHKLATGHLLDANDDALAPVTESGTVLDDTSSETHIGIYDGHTGDLLCVRPYGAQFILPTNKLTGTYSYSPGSNDKLYWDASDTASDGTPGAFVESQPGDSSTPPVLRVLNQFATHILVEVFDPSGGETGAGLTDTNITTGTVNAATANRTIDFGDFNLDFQNLGVFNIISDNLAVSNDNTAAAGRLSLREASVNGVNEVNIEAPDLMSASYGVEFFDALPGAEEIVTVDNTGKLAHKTTTELGITDTNITTGTLAAATGSRLADFAANNLTLDNVGQFTLDCDNALVFNRDTAQPAELSLREATVNGSNDVTLSPPTALAATYSVELWDDLPGAEEIATIDNTGKLQHKTTTELGISDTSITSGTLATASANRLADFATFDLTFDNVGQTTFGTDNFLVFNENTAEAAELSLREATVNGANDVTISPPAALAANYTLELPDDLPPAVSPTSGTELATIDNAGKVSHAPYITEAPQELTVGATITYDIANGRFAEVRSPGAGNTIANISNANVGDWGQLTIQGSANNPSWGSNWDFGDASGWTLTTDTLKADVISWRIDSSGTIHAVIAQGFGSPF